MNRSQIHLSILAVFFAGGIVAGDDLPKRPEFNRYSAMLNRSPFAVATAVAAPAATPNFARDLYVANAAHTADADYVTIISSGDKNLKQYLSTKGPNEDGYTISNIQWSDKPGETKVTISKDGQFATLPFNQALLTPNAPPPTAAPPGVGVPPAPGVPVQPNQSNIPKPNIPLPGTPIPTPHVRGVIQRNPAAQPPGATPYAPPASAED